MDIHMDIHMISYGSHTPPPGVRQHAIGSNGIPSDHWIRWYTIRSDGLPSDPMVDHRIQWYTIGSDGYGDVVGMSGDVWGCLNMVQTWFKQGIWKGVGGYI